MGGMRKGGRWNRKTRLVHFKDSCFLVYLGSLSRPRLAFRRHVRVVSGAAVFMLYEVHTFGGDLDGAGVCVCVIVFCQKYCRMRCLPGSLMSD